MKFSSCLVEVVSAAALEIEDSYPSSSLRLDFRLRLKRGEENGVKRMRPLWRLVGGQRTFSPEGKKSGKVVRVMS